MILGIGTDIVDVGRIGSVFHKFSDSIAIKILSSLELERYATIKTDAKRISYTAMRFAAKEAFAKALGIGMGECGLKNIQVINQESGKPKILTSIDLHKHFNLPATKEINIEISLSDEKSYAIAFVVIWS
jgi:holo-[acyl-carrier protein] synthase